MNPHLFTEWNERDEDYYIFISLRAKKILNHLLARGNKASSLWFILKETTSFTSVIPKQIMLAS